MVYTENSISVKADPVTVFEFVNDIEKWPTLFPPCRRVSILSKEGNTVIFEIEALAKNEVKVWRSRRVVYPELHKVEFKQLQTFPPVKSMKGEWIFKEQEGKTEIILTHQFEIDPSVNDLKRQELFLKEVVEENSHKELSAIKKALEKMGGQNNV